MTDLGTVAVLGVVGVGGYLLFKEIGKVPGAIGDALGKVAAVPGKVVDSVVDKVTSPSTSGGKVANVIEMAVPLQAHIPQATDVLSIGIDYGIKQAQDTVKDLVKNPIGTIGKLKFW